MPDKRRKNRDMSDLRLPELEQAISVANQILVAAAEIAKNELNLIKVISAACKQRGKVAGKSYIETVLNHSRIITSSTESQLLGKQRELFVRKYNELFPNDTTQDFQTAAQNLVELFRLADNANSETKEA